MNVAIYGRKVTRQNAGYYQQLLGIFREFGWNPVIEKNLKSLLIEKVGISPSVDEFRSHEDLKTGIDLSFSIGGDGTFIQNVKFVRDSGVPVMGINTGRLGFLANISKNDIESAMDLVRRKEFTYQKRSLIRVETERKHFGNDNYALNEITVHKKDSSSMITVNAYLEDKYLNSYWADGLIVATPSGSTAYSLSCGGPIITPGCQVHILTPIAPHNLNVRPMVVPDHMPIKLCIEGRSRTFLMALDGMSTTIRQKEDILIHKAEYMINVIKFEDNNFLDTIRNKMLWGIDRRN